MTLDELNNLNAQARTLERDAEIAQSSASKIANALKTGKPILEELEKGWFRHDDANAKYVRGIINEFGDEILRLAEMRKKEIARKSVLRAVMIRKQIADVIGEEAEKGGAA